MRFSWDERKRRLNLQEHGLDFVDAPSVFEGPTFTFEDDRFAYDEQRFVTLGLLKGIAVSLVHTETPSRIHVISFRKATRHEEAILFDQLQN
ncbi:BrnT family toxin [Usitatibacter palustris]|uniref:BrnT family toxin n=1 Tax=Usitatibacter palustris TaxID=2732487 RepID=UPI001488F883|nr:BrnT family toxin [Usitatibacter palustris]